jgi:uncharacterized Tic20 family protein
MSSYEKCLAIIAHLGYLFFGIGYLLMPIIIHFLADVNKTTDLHITQAIKAQGIVLILSMIVLCFSIIIGQEIATYLLGFITLVWIVSSIIAAFKAFLGEEYRYPFL